MIQLVKVCSWLAMVGVLVACNRQSPDSSRSAASSSGPEARQAPASSTPAATQPAITVSERYVPQPFVLPRVSNPGYIGYQACTKCHEDRVRECEPTSHFQTCRQPDPARMPAAFTSANPRERTLRLPDTDISFTMSFRDGVYWQSARRDSTGLQADSTIDLVYGAKTTSDEVYLSWHADDSMWELPVAWVYAHDCWGAAGIDRVHGTDFARELTLRCFECHNTWFEHVPGTLSTYRREGMLLGVTCERCHGPGQEHVAYHTAHPQETKAQAILYPGGLPRERLIEVCTQCHANAIRHRGPALSYRPGQVLADHYRTVTPKYSEDDHVADQISRLRQSKCFQKSEMTCITCHDPHRTGEATEGMSFHAACVQCHTAQTCKQLASTPTQLSDRCVDCHMRRYAKVNVNFDTEHDSYLPPLQRSQHLIAIDPVGTNEVLWDWYRAQPDPASQTQAAQLEQWLTAHWKHEAAQLTQVGRFTAASAAIREWLRITPEDLEAQGLLKQATSQQRRVDDLFNEAEHLRRQGQYAQAKEQLDQLLALRPTSAKAIGRLGAIYAALGQRELAEEALSQVAKLDPDDQYGLSMLAYLALNEGQYQRAAMLYDQADAIEPYNSKLNNLWATALIRSGQWAAATARLEVAVTSDPRNLQAVRQMAQVHIAQQNMSAALPWLIRAAQLTQHQSLADLMNLADGYVALNMPTLATDVARLALELARTMPPTVASEIQQWARTHNLQL